jgi:hypothetical protein
MGVVAIAATGDVASARAAQRASSTVPVVFTIGGDPVRFAARRATIGLARIRAHNARQAAAGKPTMEASE